MTAYAKRFNDLTSEDIAGLWFDPETNEQMVRNMIKNEAFDNGEKIGIIKGENNGIQKLRKICLKRKHHLKRFLN